ncbi:MAG: hypothetical protein K9K87_14320 [Desulfotignum sp.]|nr:hypothetical protein [Desulfotignum sp.]
MSTRQIKVCVILLIVGCSFIPKAYSEDLNTKWQQRIRDMEEKWEERTKNMGGNKKILHEDLENIPKVGPGPYTPQTSIIIDAAGFDITPSETARIVGISGQLIYSSLSADPGHPPGKPSLEWAGSVEEAMQCSRTGLNPVVARVVKLEMSSGLVLWIDDGVFSVAQHPKIKSFFRKQAVVVVF